MNCEACAWYVTRPLTTAEIEYLKYHKDRLIDTRFCTLGGCNGSQFLPSSGARMEGVNGEVDNL